ncbi:hypothetical protein NLJ89_g9458 [Agrocybe chaxingu]|uniref:Uncharacterized protein n=1 Tax=Agrocybe chaxingu TaxID=84603 RepID=A0A9W8MRT5_9AGAR|nr:hypothetical protein NLJ89_g9458 [Agrocybe chaxingu]
MNTHDDEAKILLPQFLKLLTGNNIPVPKAMAVAGKVYKDYNTPGTLRQLTEAKLTALGIDSQEDRKLVVNALRKAGYTSKAARPKVPKLNKDIADAASSAAPRPVASTSAPTSPSKRKAIQSTTPKKRRRKPASDVNEFLPGAPPEEIESDERWDFQEVLRTKSTVVNRAPVMMAWAMYVAERMHFSRSEALSIASVYTEMNAISKGISVGIYNKDKERGIEAEKYGPQPYVELMGRSPLYRNTLGQWRALANNKPVPPMSAFSYITRAFRQTLPHVMGSLKLLAESYSSGELNGKAWSLYADFRPKVNEWGKRSEVHCSVILDLRRKIPERSVEQPKAEEGDQQPNVRYEASQEVSQHGAEQLEPKKSKTMTVEEYEAILDDDTTFDEVDLDFVVVDPPPTEDPGAGTA